MASEKTTGSNIEIVREYTERVFNQHPALVLTAWMAVGLALYLLGEGTGQRRRAS